MRRLPQTEALIERNPVDCSTSPLPPDTVSGNRARDFNRWANAAAVLLALNRNQDAVNASGRALEKFSDSAALWYISGKALMMMDDPSEAEKALLRSAALEANVATWSELANLYRVQRRRLAAINALERLAVISPNRPPILVLLGHTYLEAANPQEAIDAFDRAEKSLPSEAANPALAEADHGRAAAWAMLGDLTKALSFEEKAVRIAPQNASFWTELARLYGLQGRKAEAEKADEHANALAKLVAP